MAQNYTYYHFTHHKISILMVQIKKACKENFFLHNHPKCFIVFNFHSFCVISTTSGQNKAHNSAIIHLMGLY